MCKVENKQLSDRLRKQKQELKNLKEIHRDCKEIEKLERKIIEKIDENVINAKQSMKKGIKDKIIEMEDKLTQMTNLRNTYACVAKKNGMIEMNPGHSCKNLQVIFQEEMDSKTSEEQDKIMRSRNIIYNMAEASSDDNTENKNDVVAVYKLLQAIRVPVSSKASIRIRKGETNKIRPMKVIFKNKEDKERVMNNLANLKNQSTYKGVSITEDYTLAERQLIKQWLQKAKERNDEEGESNHVWKIRDTPRIGLKLEKFQIYENLNTERRTS